MLPSSVILRQASLAAYSMKPGELVGLAQQSTSVKEVFRYLLAEQLTTLHSDYECKTDGPVRVDMLLSHLETAREPLKIAPSIRARTARSHSGKRSKKDQTEFVSHATLDYALRNLTRAQLEEKGVEVPPTHASGNPLMSVTVVRDPVYVSGRYIKLSREISQTPWILAGKKKTESSVQEEVEKGLLHLFESDEGVFHSAGREDNDVRMLGTGRPFVLQVIDPKTIPSAIAVSSVILEAGCGVIIEGLELHTQRGDGNRCMQMLKDGEMSKRKCYRAVVWVQNPVNSQNELDIAVDKVFPDLEKGFDVLQKTPVRVAHRRTMMLRTKHVHSLKLFLKSPHWIVMDIETGAGMYIKEFVHGDRGRTEPSISSMFGCAADILQLDVMGLTISD